MKRPLIIKVSVLIIFSIVHFCFTPLTNASDFYSVVFSEGYYPNNSTGNFGAIVIVRKSSCRDCAGEELGRFKGSTLPNPYWYYKDSNGNALWKDGTIQPMFEALRKKAEGFDLSYFGLQSLEPILDLFNEEWPIVNPGEYSINIQNSNKLGKALIVNNGSKIRTENPNRTKDYHYEIDGIWVHKGISYPSGNKGSEGCLTIHPDDWPSFIEKFPSKSKWETKGSVGILWIFRLLGEGQEPPNPNPHYLSDGRGIPASVISKPHSSKQ